MYFYSIPEPCSVQGDVKLIGRNSTNEGTVYVCMNGYWGTVCDDYWGSNDARVVCTQLHLEGEGMHANNHASANYT